MPMLPPRPGMNGIMLMDFALAAQRDGRSAEEVVPRHAWSASGRS
jgi:hypothetical protein